MLKKILEEKVTVLHLAKPSAALPKLKQDQIYYTWVFCRGPINPEFYTY